MISPQEIVSIGRITRLHGKKGELQCLLSNDLLYDAAPSFVILCSDGLLVPFRLSEWRDKGAESVLLSLQGVSSEEQAVRLVGSEVFLLRRDCVPAGGANDDTEMLVWQDLAGYRLLDAQGEDMGRIVSVDETTANTLCKTDKDMLFPLHEDLIQRLDTDKKELVLGLSGSALQ